MNTLNRPWSQEDITTLLKQTQAKKSIEDIAKKQKRSVSNIRSRLKAIAANMYLKDKMPFEKIQEITGIQKSALVIQKNPKIITIVKEPPLAQAKEQPLEQAKEQPKEQAKEQPKDQVEIQLNSICQKITNQIIHILVPFITIL
jgi:hypothetical protein